MTQPEVASQETVQAPANGGSRQRTADEVSQPAKLTRPLEESARLANERTEHNLLGIEFNVSKADGYRRA